MPTSKVNGITLDHAEVGAGEPVLLIAGSGATGRVWDLHQVPALEEAGYRVVTFTNRGVPPSDECADGFTIDDLVADTAALIEHVVGGPCRVVGTSLGAHVAQELALVRPDLVTQAVLMATRGRCDVTRASLRQAEIDLYDAGVEVPPRYAGMVKAMQNLSPRTLEDDGLARDWLDLLEMTAGRMRPGARAQLELDLLPDRLAAYAEISVPCHVISFADDIITPPALGREVAQAIPDASYDVVADAGHFGFLEQPEAVSELLLNFFRSHQARAA